MKSNTSNENANERLVKVRLSEEAYRLLNLYAFLNRKGESPSSAASEIITDFLQSKNKSIYSSVKNVFGLIPDEVVKEK